MTRSAAESITDLLPYIDRWLSYRAFVGRVPGMQVAVYFDNGVQFSRAYGYADVASEQKMTTANLFRIASHSKTFTATAILQLSETGKLRLDDTAGSFIPKLLEKGSPLANVTVRELLEHSAGVIRDGLDGDYWQHSRPFPDEDELLAIILDGGAKAPANASFNYSNIGYSLLGLIVGAVSGVSYNEYVSANIVQKLGLVNTGPEWDVTRAAEFATGYSGLRTALERRPLAHVDTRAMAAATGFFGTAEDLVNFASAHFFGDERLLSDASKRVQQREQWVGDPSTPGSAQYGLGMIIEQIGSHRMIGHSGGYPGHITRTVLDPEQGLAVSVLTNAIDGPAAEVSNGIVKLLDAALARPGAATLRSVAASTLTDSSRFVGRYANLWGVTDIVQLGGRLVSLNPAAPDPLVGMDDLTIASDDTLIIATGSGFGSVGESIRFEFDSEQKVTKIRGGGGMSLWPFDEANRADWSVPFVAASDLAPLSPAREESLS